jgi:hypothetical protein
MPQLAGTVPSKEADNVGVIGGITSGSRNVSGNRRIQPSIGASTQQQRPTRDLDQPPSRDSDSSDREFWIAETFLLLLITTS